MTSVLSSDKYNSSIFDFHISKNHQNDNKGWIPKMKIAKNLFTGNEIDMDTLKHNEKNLFLMFLSIFISKIQFTTYFI